MNNWLFAGFICFSLSSCKSGSGSTALKDVHSGTEGHGTAEWGWPFGNGSLTCPADQEPLFATLKRKNIVSPEKLGFPGDIVVEPEDLEVDQNLADADSREINYVTRFDFCMDSSGTSLVLHRLVIRKKGEYSFGALQPVFFSLNMTTPQDVPALTKAFNEQDYSDIELIFFATTDDRPSYFIKGHKLDAGKSILTISSFNKGTDPSQIRAGAERKGTITMGELEIRNGFEEFENPVFPYQEVTYSLEKDHLKFLVKYEVNFRPGGYKNYRYERKGVIQISDANPKLPKPIVLEVDADKMEQSMEYVSSHHNLNDKLIFKDPAGNAIYTLSPGGDDDGFLDVEYKESLGILNMKEPIRRVLGEIVED
jgi:hypothetical protein